MKNLIYFFFVCLLLSCSNGQEPEVLIKAESMLDNAPDSALSLLNKNKREMSQYGKAFQMKYDLLYAEAMNKTYTSMDTLKFMGDVLEYYKHHGNKDEKTRANYMMGCVYRDRGNSPVALQFYYDAIEQADTTSKKCNYSLVSRIYGQIASIYMEQRYPAKEIDAWRIGRHYAILAKDTLSAIQYLESSGDAYLLQGKEDSANICFDRAYDEYRKYGYKNYAAACQIYKVRSCLKKGDTDDAKKALEIYRKESGLFNNEGVIMHGCEGYYYYLGAYYEKTGNYELAVNSFRKLLEYPEDIQNIENGYKGLMEAYSFMGKNDSTVKYATLYASANDSANILKSSSDIIRMQSLYDYTESQNLAVEKSKESRNLWRILFISLLVIIVIVFLFVNYFRKNREVSKKAAEALEQLHKAENDLKTFQNDADGFVKQKTEEILRLRNALSAYKNNFKLEEWNSEQDMLHLNIVEHIRDLAGKGRIMSGSEWRDLEGSLEKLMPNFYKKMQELRENLTEQEYKVCILTRLNFTPTDIANLLAISQQRVTNIRGNINKKIFHNKGTQNFSTNIARL